MSATFLGYPRSDGGAGTRNHVLVLPGGWECQQIVNMVDGTVTPTSADLGVARTRSDRETIARVHVGLALNPNVYAVVIVTGGGKINEGMLNGLHAEDPCRAAGKPVEIIDCDGWDAIAQGSRAAARLVHEASAQPRQEVDASNLQVGVKCGASDPTSGLVGNPSLGRMFDRVVEAGGTAIFSETTEVIGAEHELADRCVNPQVRKQFLDLIENHEEVARGVGQDIRTINPVPANIAAGISTLEEKSLGAVHKGGTAPIAGVLDYAERPAAPGLYFMDSSVSHVVVLPGMAGAGCNIVFFQLGGGGWSRRTLTGGQGIVAPQMWVTGNPTTAARVTGIDFSSGPAISEGRSIEEMGDKLFELVLEVASGKLARTEMLRFFDPVQYYLPGPSF